MGRLEAVLRAGHFALTAETTPPDAASPEAVLRKAGCLKGLADAVNVTDAAGARAHMSALPAAAILAREGIEPVLQFTMRDRNRIAMQGDLIGAAALGIPNVLSLHGDDPKGGDQPEAKPVFDFETANLMQLARDMRDSGKLPSGREIASPPKFFIGAADIPKVPDEKWSPEPLRKKIAGGAGFLQTQFCFDLTVAERYFARLADEGITEKVGIIIGVGPIRSAKSARWMNENLFGVHVPEATIQRLEGAKDQAAEGRKICVELIEGLKQMKGPAGAHLMAPAQGPDAIAAVLGSLSA